MNLSEVQKTLESFFKSKSITLVLMQYSAVLTLVYPVYLIMTRASFLHIITGILSAVSIIFYFAYLFGLILSFAKNDMLTVIIAFALITFIELLDLFLYSISVNAILSFLAYAAVTVMCFYYYKNNTDI
ncbi:MAG: hypothetical protein LUF26_07115 [Firmicutes bacterium]|nr:hypothetical protein [Bacillota bacterium]